MDKQNLRQLLESAIRAAKAHNRDEAYRLLRQVIDADPSNVTAWLWLAGVTQNPREARVALNQVERLEPDNTRIAKARQWLEGAIQPSAFEIAVEEAMQPSAFEVAAEEAIQSSASEIEIEEAVAGTPDQPETEDWSPFDLDGLAPGVDDDGEQLLPSGESEARDDSADTAPQPVQPLPDTWNDQATTKPGSTAHPGRRWLWLVLALFLLAIIFCLALARCSSIVGAQHAPALSPTPDANQRIMALQPRFNNALTEQNWEDAVAILQLMRALDSSGTALQRDAAYVYHQLALQRRDEGDLEAALSALDESLALVPDDALVERERWLLAATMDGLQAYHSGNWEMAIRVLAPVYREAPEYLNVAESLYSAHYQLGLARQESGDLLGAQESFQAAIDIFPERLKARQKAEEIAWLLVPPTPTATPTVTPTMTPTTTPTPTATPTPDPSHQRIVVDISDQQMYVYLDENLLWQWTVSTGEPGKDTAIGNFAVRSKIDNAYGSTWDLDMPHWLGIYQSGPLENGIHGLPVQRATGSKLWEGLLGQRVSYGCVILSDENAQTLYDWAHIGTPVIVQW